MGNRHFTDLPDGWKGAFLAALGAGNTIARAAEACQVSVAHLYRLRTDDDNFRAEWDAAKKLRTEYRRDWVLDKLHEIAESDEHKAQIPALFKLFDALPENRARDITIGGDPDRPVLVAHEARLTLANLLTAAGHVEGLSTSPQRQLPAAQILAQPDEEQPAASDLPLRPAP